MTKAGKPLDVGQVKAIFEKLSKHESKSSIAKELGIHVRTVIRWSQLEEEEAIKKAMKLRERTTDYQIPREEIENEPLVKDWLSTYSGRGGENRSTAILYFCNLVEKNPKELIEEAEQEIREGKLLRERGYFKYFQNFEQMLQAKEYAPYTIKALVYGVKAFYQYFQISELPKELRRKTNHVEGLEGNEEAKLTKSDIKDMLSVCRYLRDRAIILTLSSSGLGGAEARNLTLGDFFKGYDAKTGICELSITREKTLYRFTTYLSPEASQTIREYLKIERGVSEEDFEKYPYPFRQEVDSGAPFEDFYKDFKKVIKKYNPAIIVWGRNDFLALNQAYSINHLPSLALKTRYINLLKLHKNYFNLKNDLGLFNALNLYESFDEIQSHNAYEDAEVTKKIFYGFKDVVNNKFNVDISKYK